jgi:hypothetical protein
MKLRVRFLEGSFVVVMAKELATGGVSYAYKCEKCGAILGDSPFTRTERIKPESLMYPDSRVMSTLSEHLKTHALPTKVQPITLEGK